MQPSIDKLSTGISPRPVGDTADREFQDWRKRMSALIHGPLVYEEKVRRLGKELTAALIAGKQERADFLIDEFFSREKTYENHDDEESEEDREDAADNLGTGAI